MTPTPVRLLAVGILVGCAAPDDLTDVQARLALLSPAVLPGARPDVTNRYADDPRAAALGKKLFFDPRFSGPLLDEDDQGTAGTLGLRGETGRVSCAGVGRSWSSSFGSCGFG